MVGRLYMRAHAPYFSRTLLGLIPHPEPRCQTLGVTPGMVLYFNPTFLLSLTEQELGTVLWHETQHVLRNSFDRLTGVPQDVSNICEDLAINSSSLHNKAWKFPDIGCEFPSNYGFPDDLTAEEYYALLPPHPQPPSGNGVGCGACGGGAGNSGPNSALEQELDSKYGRSPEEVEMIQEATANAILQHEKSVGSIPGKWGEWARGILKAPVIRWEPYFHNLVSLCVSRFSFGDADYSIMKPSRRIYAMPAGPFRPGLVGYEPEVALILDTSGSMDLEADIKPCLREARGALLKSGVEKAWFLQGDAGVSTPPKRVAVRDFDKVLIQGRGGTDFRVPIAAALELKPKPNIIIYYTDAYGPAPEHKPVGMEFIWCIVGEGKEPASWGHRVRIPKAGR